MAAARNIFATNGFENARIEEIAAKAGKTRGAFYDNFDSKEDVFFAIFEEDLMRSQEKYYPLLSQALTLEKRIEVLSRHLMDVLRDKQKSLLYLEFKMYAIRHPRKRKRLAELHTAMCIRWCTTDMETLFPKLAEASLSNRQQFLQVSAALDGLALNLLFVPDRFDQKQLMRYLRTNLREALQYSRSKLRRKQSQQ